MYVARLLYPVKVLGPGNRIGIWLAGCQHQCPGCSNPELWKFEEKYRTSMAVVMRLIADLQCSGPVDGFTVTGGDPFEQPDALRRLLPELSKISEDILVYTGYQFDQIRQRYPDILTSVGVMIDGTYLEERNNGCRLRGSDNQKIYVLRQSLKHKYADYLETNSNEIQNFSTGSSVVSVGIHEAGYQNRLDQAMGEKGVEA